MKILAVSKRFPPDTFGGGEISVNLWCQLLAKENEVHVLTSGNGAVETNDFTVHRLIPIIQDEWPLDLHNNELFYLKTYKSLNSLLKKESFEIVHAFNMTSIPPVVYAARRKKIPVIATVNDHWGTCYFRSHFHEGKVNEICTPSILKRNLKRNEVSNLALPYILYTMKFRKRTMGKCNKLIAVSSWVKRILEKNGLTNVEVINNPVDLGTFKPKKFTATGQILYIGRLDKGKGIETLIKASALAQEKVKFSLVLVGTGQIDHYKRLAARHNVSTNFLGKLDHLKVPDVINESELVIAPFERIEAFPRAVTEAAACGRAVITTSISGSVDIIEDGKNGLIVPPRNPEALGKAIMDLMSNKKRLEAMGIEGRKIAEGKLDKNILLKKLLNAYNSVLGVYDSGRHG